MPSASKGRKGKLGKNKHRIASYYNSGRNFYNKARKLVHHLRRHPDDKVAIEAMKLATAPLALAYQRQFRKVYEGQVNAQ